MSPKRCEPYKHMTYSKSSNREGRTYSKSIKTNQERISPEREGRRANGVDTCRPDEAHTSETTDKDSREEEDKQYEKQKGK